MGSGTGVRKFLTASGVLAAVFAGVARTGEGLPFFPEVAPVAAPAERTDPLAAPMSVADPSVQQPEDGIVPLMLGPSIVNPAEENRAPGAPESRPADEGGVTHPWEMPAVNVVGEAVPELREEQRIGSYKQPVWTADRRFAETRVYVRPEGSLQFEYWYIPTVNRKGPTQTVNQFELEYGLPHRFQLDLYLSPRTQSDAGNTYIDQSIELRYAFADWNEIWGNPTAYIEFTRQDQAADQLEMKMLFGGEIAPRWHWGADLTYQHDLGFDNMNVYETTAGVSYTIKDNLFDVGAEFKLQEYDIHDRRSHLTDNLLLGPSFQYRPIPRMHIDLVPLIGLTHESPALETYFVVGWEF